MDTTSISFQLIGLIASISFGITGIVSAVIGLYVRSMVKPLETKINTLWDIYVVEAVKERRQQGLTQKNSPEELGPEWYKIPLEKRFRLEARIRQFQEPLSAVDIAFNVWRAERDTIKTIAEENGITEKGILGALILLAEKAGKIK